MKRPKWLWDEDDDFFYIFLFLALFLTFCISALYSLS